MKCLVGSEMCIRDRWLMVTCPRETLTVTSRRSVLRKIDSSDLVVFADPAPLRIRASAIWKASL